MSTMKRFVMVLSLAVLGLGATAYVHAAPATAASPGSAALDKAAKDNKYLFVFFYREDTQQSRVMRGVFQTAMAKVTGKADSTEIQVDNPAEAQLVARLGASRAPMPLVLAIAPNGAITGGFPTRFDESQLQKAFVSPGTAKCMKALQDRNIVLLCVQAPTAPVQQGVKDLVADQQFARSAVVVLDPADQAEASFLKGLQIEPQANTSLVVLMSPPGSVVGKMASDATKAELVAKIKSAGSCGAGCSCHQ